nr:HNH endonuclease signature motif containing protein [Kibdelosporangium sp. MJ126-NF4]CEL20028.1 hypothetical protein [Kibdelosporangium sp. MJ126-NF4]CTQ97251.1 hypothetical protein [Kibdelosporangium sp. MJ126-NF4]
MFEQLAVAFHERQAPPDIPVSQMDREQTRNYIADRYRQRNTVDAELIRGLARFAELHPPQRSGIEVGDGAAEDLAIELCLSPVTTGKQLSQAQTLVTRLPATVEAMAEGEVDVMRAKAMHDYTLGLDEDQALAVEKRVLDGGTCENLTRFKHAIRRELIWADPDGEEERRQVKKAGRDAVKWHKPDGTSAITITLQPHEAEQAYSQLDLLAKLSPKPGRSRAQARADVFMDLVTFKKTVDRPAAAVHVLAPMTTLMGLNREPGEISGYGPITAEYARELAHHATWRRVITDPTGQVLEVSQKRFASPALRRHLQLRDRTCRQPGCAVPAQRCETDHSQPHSHGGVTSVGNLAMFCKRHNLMRQRTNWRLEHPKPGTLVFTTPSKQTHVTTPQAHDVPPF